jgi:hypothetical protein
VAIINFLLIRLYSSKLKNEFNKEKEQKIEQIEKLISNEIQHFGASHELATTYVTWVWASVSTAFVEYKNRSELKGRPFGTEICTSARERQQSGRARQRCTQTTPQPKDNPRKQRKRPYNCKVSGFALTQTDLGRQPIADGVFIRQKLKKICGKLGSG